ncbi:MAG TPA: MarP family serine protease [Mycobacteriales bacterium]|nr:MarP family serine protease [Mycobacteriales bacterium]
MSWLDLGVLALAVAFGVSGYRQGFLTAALSFVGFFGGAVIGAQVADPVARQIAGQSSGRVAVAVAVVLAFALAGQVLAVWVGGELRRRLTWHPAQRVDAVLGALVSGIGVLLVVWMVAAPLAAAPYPRLSAAVRDSEVIRAIDEVVPKPVRALYASLRDVVRQYDFPEVFGPLVPTRVRDVRPPDQKLLKTAAVRRARVSVVKVTGVADSCARRIEGSGFVFAADRVMTNAHVVAGVRRPRVEVGGQQHAATVAVFDAARDIAVLRVPDLGVPALPFAARPASSGDDAIVVGYPEDGPFFVGPARVRDRMEIRGPDIYDDRTVVREVYSVRGDVRSGNSGGPLLAPDGSVYGVIFAAAVDEPDTGFALTAREVAGDARAGAAAATQVATDGCA